jgi:hypothetical protein
LISELCGVVKAEMEATSVAAMEREASIFIVDEAGIKLGISGEMISRNYSTTRGNLNLFISSCSNYDLLKRDLTSNHCPTVLLGVGKGDLQRYIKAFSKNCRLL